jgi:hypothetical protein
VFQPLQALYPLAQGPEPAIGPLLQPPLNVIRFRCGPRLITLPNEKGRAKGTQLVVSTYTFVPRLLFSFPRPCKQGFFHSSLSFLCRFDFVVPIPSHQNVLSFIGMSILRKNHRSSATWSTAPPLTNRATIANFAHRSWLLAACLPSFKPFLMARSPITLCTGAPLPPMLSWVVPARSLTDGLP